LKNLVLFLSLLLIHPGQIKAGISDNAAVKAIAGEAEGEGPRGMLAVACALRNRGTLKGVYGLQAARIRAGRVNPSVIRTARWAWRESKKRDITGGADHWHNLKREGPRKWTREYKKTVVIGKHVFYKSTDQRRYIK